MATNPYATLDDLAAYLGTEPPPGAQKMLRDACDLLDANPLINASYQVDTGGNPTDVAVQAALRKATCQQVEWWIQTGDPLDEMGQYSQFSFEGVLVTRRTSGGAPDRVAPKARDTLRVAGLYPGRIDI